MKFDAISFCEENGIKYWTSGKNVSKGWLNIECPLCDDYSNHGGINPFGVYYHCWKCGGNSLDTVIAKLLNVNFKEAIKIKKTFSQAGFGEKINRKKAKNISKINMPGESLLPNHKAYLLSRDFEPDYLVEKYKIKGTNYYSKQKGYENRIMIPVYYNNEIVSYLGRSISVSKSALRYRNCSEELEIKSLKSVLYNLDNCKGDSVIVMEGVTDVWRFGDNCCATFGIAYTIEQVKILAEKFETVYILFDKERQAQGKARALVIELQMLGVDCQSITWDSFCDPAEMSEKDALQIKSFLFGSESTTL